MGCTLSPPRARPFCSLRCSSLPAALLAVRSDRPLAAARSPLELRAAPSPSPPQPPCSASRLRSPSAEFGAATRPLTGPAAATARAAGLRRHSSSPQLLTRRRRLSALSLSFHFHFHHSIPPFHTLRPPLASGQRDRARARPPWSCGRLGAQLRPADQCQSSE